MTGIVTGIYQILNTENGKRYIGSAVNIRRRWRAHKSCLNNKRHHSEHLQRSWNLYGNECFVFAILEYCEKELLIKHEQFYIDALRPEYNILPIAGSCLGRIHTQMVKDKIASGMMGKKNSTGYRWTQKQKDKFSDLCKGKTLTQETKDKLSAANKGHINIKETRLKISVANKNRRLTQETKDKISITNKGKIITQEQRNKISAANKGKSSWLGRKHSQEAKDKMSVARFAFYARMRGETPLKDLIGE